MYGRRVLPFLLIAGGLMMFMRHKRYEFLGQGEEGEKRTPLSPHCGPRSDWSKRVPPMFDAERWHKRAHEQEQAAQQPAV